MKPLHEHNQRTYKNICRMYGEGIQRIAVVQPTGSGKSFLMGKLIEDNPDSRFFVLSTSHKINDQFKEKLDEEMLKRLECNIYCNMPNMKKEDMEALQPDYILLDEMHRALAREWSKGIKVLLEMYPSAKVLGLSATPIRYLDKRRNVVKELFNDNLACDMNLSQAILDGILPMARYVCGVYSYEKDAESLNKKIERSYNSEEEKKELLKQVKVLKENLDKGNGVSDIFRKYIMTGNEKFVVFLKDTKHLSRMRPVIKKWFDDAGFSSVRMYEVHSKNIDKDKEFQAFKDDTQEGIKLCLSVNMVAEGIHGDINGVIMLRETISPNLYFQMIGRAFACDKKIIPLIFDLVANSQFISETADNFPNELRGEIERRKKECEKEGKEYEVGFDVDEFIVMDQFMDVVSGFKEIEERLEGSWDLYIKALKQYKEREGDYLVPIGHVEVVNGVGLKLGQWCNNKRNVKKGNSNYSLTAERIKQLDEIGFIWDVFQYNFDNNIKALKQYKERAGNCYVPVNHMEIVNGVDVKLGRWCSNIRKTINGEYSCMLSEEMKKQLNQLGFVWNLYDYKFLMYIKDIKKFVQENKCLPGRISENIKEKRMANFISRERYFKNKLGVTYPQWKKEKMEEIEGFVWNPTENYFLLGCKYYENYTKKNNTFRIPRRYKTEDGFDLDSWNSSQKNKYREGKLSSNEKVMLEKIGFVFSVNNDYFDKKFELLKKYMEINGCDSDIPQSVVYKGEKIGAFVSSVRSAYRNNSISEYRREKLESINFIWDIKDKIAFY